MPFNGVESLFICGAKSGLDYAEMELEARERKRQNEMKLKKKAEIAATTKPSQPSQPPEEEKAVKPKEKPARIPHQKTFDDVAEEWTRIRNMERQREIQSLKQQNTDLKNEIDKMQELLVKKKDQVDTLKKVVNDKDTLKVSAEDKKKDIERLKLLEATYTELQQKHQLLLKEKDQILSTLQKVKLEKENAEKRLEALKKEKEEQTLVLQQTSEELEKGKQEIENLYKMYESILNDKESERLSIESENKALLRDLLVRCKSVEALESARESPVSPREFPASACRSPTHNPNAQIADEDNKDDDDAASNNDNDNESVEEFAAIAPQDMITLISNLEFEKGQKEEELEKTKQELVKMKELNVNIQQDLKTTRAELKRKLQEYKQLQEQQIALLQRVSTMSEVEDVGLCQEKELEIESLKKLQVEDQDSITKLTQKLSEVQNLVSEKNAEIFNLSAQIDEFKRKTEQIEEELKSNSSSITPNNDVGNFGDIVEQYKQTITKKDNDHREEIERIRNEHKEKIKFFEGQLSQTRKQSELFEDTAEKLQRQCEQMKMQHTIENNQKSLADSIENVEESFVQSEDLNITFNEQSVEEGTQTELERYSVVKQLRSDISEFKKQAEMQEDIISKREYDQAKLESQIQRLHETIIAMEEKLKHYTKENVALMDELECERVQHEALKANYELHCQNTETEIVLQKREEELDEYKNRLESQELKCEALLKEKEDEITRLETQIANVQNELEIKLRDFKHVSLEHQKFKRQTTESDRALQEEQEAYLIGEIERQQYEFKSQIAAAERDKEKYIYDMMQKYEEKIMDLEVEYEQLKSNEIEILKDDHNTRLSLLTMQREELLETVKKLESVLIQQKFESNEQLRLFEDVMQRKNAELVDLRVKDDTQRELLDVLTRAVSEEKSKYNDGTNRELVNILMRLGKKLDEASASEYRSEPDLIDGEQRELSTTWPLMNASTSPFSHVALHSSLRNDTMTLKQQLQQTRNEICSRMKTLSEHIVHQTAVENAESPLNVVDHIDDHYVDSEDESAVSFNCSSPLQQNYHDITEYFSTHHGHSSDSPYKNTMIDSGIVEGCCSPTLLYKHQLQTITNIFEKFEKQCGDLNKVSNFSQEDWYKDLQVWRRDVNKRLRFLRQRVYNENFDETPLSAFARSIVFRPTSSEVKAIIESVNEKYERLSDEY